MILVAFTVKERKGLGKVGGFFMDGLLKVHFTVRSLWIGRAGVCLCSCSLKEKFRKVAKSIFVNSYEPLYIATVKILLRRTLVRSVFLFTRTTIFTRGLSQC